MLNRCIQITVCSALIWFATSSHDLEEELGEQNLIHSKRRNDKEVWRYVLQTMAPTWTNQCSLTEPSNGRVSTENPNVNIRNIAAHSDWSWRAVINSWAEQKTHVIYGQTSTENIDDFVQMMFLNTSSIGCGQNFCPIKQKEMFICSYAHGGSSLIDSKPLGAGPECDDCDKNCVNLCGCGSEMCCDLGSMNITDYGCSCHDNCSGDTCSKLTCPVIDDDICISKEECLIPGVRAMMCGSC